MYKPINGFTKDQIIKILEIRVKEKCTNAMGNCAYRGENGTVCAVGAFIPNELYYPHMENKIATDLVDQHPALKLVMPLEPKALRELQEKHDTFDEKQTYEYITDRLVNWVKLYVED